MKGQILSMDGKIKGKIDLPKFFQGKGREDFVKKVFLANPKRQPYGAFLRAGMEASAHGIFKHRRRAWKGSYGMGIAKTPSTVMSRSGTRFTRRGAFASNTRGGREAHPPKASKNWKGEINKKENTKALISALILNNSLEVLKRSYPKIDFSSISFPLVIEDGLSDKKKVKEIKEIFKIILGKASEILKKKILIVSEKPLKTKNLKMNVRKASELNIRDLIISGKPGRFMIFTESSMKILGEKWCL